MLKVQNTLTGKKEEFKPRDEGKVGMYVCGPTVYNYIHIGNARAYIAFDVIHRWLEHRGYEVTYVRNLTDVDDKIIKKAKEDNTTVEEVTKKYTKAFHDDMEILGVKPPEKEPTATGTINEMIKMIEGLINKGLAYQIDGDVYYKVTAFKDYGKLSKRTLEEMQAGKRVEVDTRKKHPMDFALWKKAKEGEPAWDSPWGQGRPGWHIECSAMSLKYLGENFDIHGGGQDLIFPHHENEIAQSEGFTDNQFVKYWLHNGFVNIEKEKMAKSVGNVILVKDLEEKYRDNLDGLRNDVRMLFLATSYHSPINFSYKNLAEAHSAVERVENSIARIEQHANEIIPKEILVKNNISSEPKKALAWFKDEFSKHMNDDFNTPQAIGSVFGALNWVNRFLDKHSMVDKKTSNILLNFVSTVLDYTTVLGFNFEPKPLEEYQVEGRVKVKLRINMSAILPPKKKELTRILSDITGIKDDLPVEKVALNLLAIRQKAKMKKDFKVADLIRNRLDKVGYIIEDTPQGPVLKEKPRPK